MDNNKLKKIKMVEPILVNALDEMRENVYMGRDDIGNNTFDEENENSWSEMYNWRNHTPDKIKEIWKYLTKRERLIVMCLSELLGSNKEEWD